MKITYDQKVDAVYVRLRVGHYDHTKKVTDSILVDVSKKGEVLGLEILDASRNIGKIRKEKIAVEFSTVQA